MFRFLIFYVIYCLSVNQLTAQGINGIWQGKLTMEPGGCFPEYYIELQIEADHGDVSGISYDYFDSSRYVKLSFWGTASGGSKVVRFAEKQILSQQIPEDCVPCMKTYDLRYSRENNVESLTGEWVGQDMGTIAGCPPGKIFLKRAAKSAFEERRKRATQVAQVCYVDSPVVELAFYDNGEIDGDSITVSLDNQIIVSHQALSLSPIRVQLKLDPSREHEVVMHADNLGKIPPNTALVVLTSGVKRYEVLLSASMEENSSIRIICGKQPSSDSELRN